MAGHPSMPIKYLSLQAGLYIRAGLDEERALKMITTYPAELLGLSKRVGKLTKGLDADLIRLSGPPLELQSKVIETWINGALVINGQAQLGP